MFDHWSSPSLSQQNHDLSSWIDARLSCVTFRIDGDLSVAEMQHRFHCLSSPRQATSGADIGSGIAAGQVITSDSAIVLPYKSWFKPAGSEGVCHQLSSPWISLFPASSARGSRPRN